MQWEEDELREFELLEQAAAELSLLSQTSQSHTSAHHTPPTPQAHSPQQWLPSMSHHHDRHTSVPQIENDDTDDEIDTSLPFTYHPRDEDDPAIKSDNELDNTLRASPPPTTSSHYPPTTSSHYLPTTSLHPPTTTSLAAGIDFNDEESWDSFNKSSPERTSLRPLDFPEEGGQYLTSAGGSTEDLLERGDSSSTVAGNIEHRFDDFSQPRGPVISGSIGKTTGPTIIHASAPPENRFYPQPSPRRHDYPRSIDPSDKPIPPPSVLISKLFPALRKTTVKPPPIIQTPSPVQSVDGDSGKGSSVTSVTSIMGDELRLKLAQLETEIERYRCENGRLERLRREKEEVGTIALHVLLGCDVLILHLNSSFVSIASDMYMYNYRIAGVSFVG